MPLKEHTMQWAHGAKHKIKRVARGTSSGHGKTAGRGHKGQNSRTGGGTRPGFEGGQTPIFRRLPKRGFRNAPFRTIYAVVNLDQLEKLDVASADVTLLRQRVVSDKNKPIKLLGDGTLTKSISIEVHGASASAKQKVEAAGGKITILPWRS